MRIPRRVKFAAFGVHFLLLYNVGALLGWAFVNHNAFEGTYDPTKIITVSPLFLVAFGLAFAVAVLLLFVSVHHLAPLYLEEGEPWD